MGGWPRRSGLGAVLIALGAAAACHEPAVDTPCERGASSACLAALGALCSADGECSSGFCVSGVCCDRVCDGGCEACNLVGAAGTCAATPGVAPAGACEPGAVCSLDGRCAGGHRWSLLSSAAGADEITAAAPAPGGAALVGGRFTTELRLGQDVLAKGESDRAAGFLAMLDPAGSAQWVVEVGVGATVDAVAAGHERVYVAGTHAGAASLFGAARPSEGVDAYVAAVDERGLVWLWSFAGPGTQRIDRLTALPDGGLALGTRAQEAATGAPLNASLVVLDGDGVPRWSLPIASAGNDRIGGLAVADGILAVTGAINGSVTVGGITLAHEAAEDVFVLWVGLDGHVVHARSYGGAGSDVGQALAFGPDGDLFVAGFFTKSIDFGDGSMLSAGCEDVFVTRLDASGQARFSRRLGDAEPDVVSAMLRTPEGTVVVGGDFAGDLDFAGDRLVGQGELDLWVASWSVEGEPAWATTFGGPGRERMRALVPTASGVVVAGRAQGPLDFGGPTLEPVGAADAFVAEIGR